MNEPWTVMTVPRVVSAKIRFITPDVAIVDEATTVEGAVTLTRSVPLLFVMKKESTTWRTKADQGGPSSQSSWGHATPDHSQRVFRRGGSSPRSRQARAYQLQCEGHCHEA